MKRLILHACLLLVLASPAAAQTSGGVRAGVSGDPDQFVIGGHLETSPLVERLTFRPNLELGVGDDVTLVAFNFEFVYSFPLRDEPWRVYAGAGPALNLYSFDRGRNDDTSAEAGLNFLVGIQHSRGFFSEFKVGAIDSPDIKFVVGYAFR
jgi:hypothetical protein